MSYPFVVYVAICEFLGLLQSIFEEIGRPETIEDCSTLRLTNSVAKTKSPSSFFTSIIKHLGPTSYPIPDFFLKIFVNGNLSFRLMQFESRCTRTPH